MDRYLEIKIGGKKVDLSSIEDLGLLISYKLEDMKSFVTKKGSSALSLTFPATVNNDQVTNLFHNPGIEDLTTNQEFKGVRDSKITYMGQELLVGKAFLKRASHTAVPTNYEYDFYGNNSDWMIDLKETTLYDLIKHLSFTFDKTKIIDSWSFDGTSEAMPYVFIPIRYGKKMESFVTTTGGEPIEDYNMIPEYMRPSLSKYWFIYWAFKSIGYTIKSDFFDLPYFRRQVMPWTWGSFLDSDGSKLDVLKFLAKSSASASSQGVDFTGYWDLHVDNDYQNGGYDNSNSYTYPSSIMTWTYLTGAAFSFGLINVNFHLNLFLDCEVTWNSSVELRVQYFKNGQRVFSHDDNGNGTLLLLLKAPAVGMRRFNGPVEDWFNINVIQGDVITAKFYMHAFDTDLGHANITATCDEFTIDYLKIPLGGTINFDNILAFKKHKFLDLLAGIIDEFDLVVQANSATKEVYFEPSHPYSLTNDFSTKSGGYFNGTQLDWNTKQDIIQESDIELFTDSERELLFQYQDDASDGTLKKTQDRTQVRVGQAKYVLPERFMTGTKEIENRFFSPTMHYNVDQWTLGGEPPQMIIMAPENISNLSSGEAQNTFNPKSIYYKGLTTDYKWIFDGSDQYSYPYGFAVNYKTGGEDDPILSYSDETIGTATGKGLLRRFFNQRLAIMANGQIYTTYFRLNNRDIANFLHREFIICRKQKWEIIQIEYKPLSKEASKVIMRKWYPIK